MGDPRIGGDTENLMATNFVAGICCNTTLALLGWEGLQCVGKRHDETDLP